LKKTVIKKANVVNEGIIKVLDVLIAGERIEKIADTIDVSGENVHEVDATNLFLLPGLIDDHVHFREPGYPLKGTIYSESRAAVAGGITSFMDMPNTLPVSTSIDRLEKKFALAQLNSLANYSFFMGIDGTNLEEALKIDTTHVCGLTDDGLYLDGNQSTLANQPAILEELFSRTNNLVALHCEDDAIIRANENFYLAAFGNEIPIRFHPFIRNESACFAATQRVIEISRRHDARVHILHVSTKAEVELLDDHLPIRSKRITGEACVHHLWFSSVDYDELGEKIKWNPSIKSENDRVGLLSGLKNKRLDIIATDHAPHTVLDKSGNYFQCKSGGPLVQHALPILIELYHQERITLPEIVEKTSHNVAEIFRIKERGFIREGYYADLVLLDLNKPWISTKVNSLYKCGWSPFENFKFSSQVMTTFVNGTIVFNDAEISNIKTGKRLLFEAIR